MDTWSVPNCSLHAVQRQQQVAGLRWIWYRAGMSKLGYDEVMNSQEAISSMESTNFAKALELARQRLIVALDVSDSKSAMRLVAELEGTCNWFKVGLELFVAAGPAVLEPIVARGHNVFLDLKLHDIPNTVAGAVRSAAGLGVRMLTVHAGGGPAMLEAARNALAGIKGPPELLAVTVLTSMDAEQLHAIGVERSPSSSRLKRWRRWGSRRGFAGSCARRRRSPWFGR